MRLATCLFLLISAHAALSSNLKWVNYADENEAALAEGGGSGGPEGTEATEAATEKESKDSENYQDSTNSGQDGGQGSKTTKTPDGGDVTDANNDSGSKDNSGTKTDDSRSSADTPSEGLSGALKPILAIYQILSKLRDHYIKLGATIKEYFRELITEPFKKHILLQKIVALASRLDEIAKDLNKIVKLAVANLDQPLSKTIITAFGLVESALHGIKEILGNVKELFNLEIFDEAYINEIKTCILTLKEKAGNAIKASKVISRRSINALTRLFAVLRMVAAKISQRVRAYLFGNTDATN